MTTAPTRYRATLAYDGTDYFGFQRQAGATPTIQLALEDAIAQVTGQAVRVLGAGRTDAGVHATGQVIAFDVAWAHDDTALLRALNATLPPAIALQDIRQQPGFHPRFDALSRAYAYRIVRAQQRQPLLNRYAWHIYGVIDLDIMQQGAKMLIGVHDFATFGTAPQGEITLRHVLGAAWTMQPRPYGEDYVFYVEANAFLYHMVRRMVGMLVKLGWGQLSLSEFEGRFRMADAAQAKAIAPPQGLVLEKVTYPAAP